MLDKRKWAIVDQVADKVLKMVGILCGAWVITTMINRF